MKLYEVMDGRRYVCAVLPSDGNPRDVLSEVRQKHPRARLVEIENGKRTDFTIPFEEVIFPEIQGLNWDEIDRIDEEIWNG